MKLWRVTILFLVLAGCQVFRLKETESTTLPSWHSLVSELLVEDDTFPKGWVRIRDLPQGSLTDQTINHVYRSWWDEAHGNGKVDQAIWRAYSIADAEEFYDELRESQFEPSRPLAPDTIFVPFKPPSAIDFQSETADGFYLACGWWDWAYCEVVARYRNYVTEMSLDLKAEYDGHMSDGLTYAEIGSLVRAMDAKFAEFLRSFPLATPTP